MVQAQAPRLPSEVVDIILSWREDGDVSAWLQELGSDARGAAAVPPFKRLLTSVEEALRHRSAAEAGPGAAAAPQAAEAGAAAAAAGAGAAPGAIGCATADAAAAAAAVAAAAATASELCDGLLELCWEKLHLGYWKDVHVAWRNGYTVACVARSLLTLLSSAPIATAPNRDERSAAFAGQDAHPAAGSKQDPVAGVLRHAVADAAPSPKPTHAGGDAATGGAVAGAAPGSLGGGGGGGGGGEGSCRPGSGTRAAVRLPPGSLSGPPGRRVPVLCSSGLRERTTEALTEDGGGVVGDHRNGSAGRGGGGGGGEAAPAIGESSGGGSCCEEGALQQLEPPPCQLEQQPQEQPQEQQQQQQQPQEQPQQQLDPPGLEQFLVEAMAPERPVVVPGAMAHWPALQRWADPSYLLRVAGGRTVPVEVGQHYLADGWGQQLMTLRHFLQRHVLTEPGQAATAGAAAAAGRMAAAAEPAAGAEQAAEAEPVTAAQAAEAAAAGSAGADGSGIGGGGCGGGAAAAATVPVGYLAQHPLFDQIPPLRADFATPDYCCLGDDGEPHAVNAWLGPAGTTTPLHTDPAHNLLAQVVGRKYVRLYAPSCTAALHPFPAGSMNSNSSQVDLDRIQPRRIQDQTRRIQIHQPAREEDIDEGEDKEEVETSDAKMKKVMDEALHGAGAGDLLEQEEEWPGAAELPFQDVVLGPGQMLYIPPGWWHFVRSLTTSFSVSFWWK
ncbi:hypothetical protein HYH02_008048 [Chlamydomonas schloesseri]|uniref:JmjC domain-containing protein n=1 Tax=Chlamydomonas schloesseri TaxID=2026947 RepID=A0A835WG61_9CHLO|nr:hypothetical protein HYH02_008048 [Chlamydomonas schloesseri]|eukprot:KAG2446892.1 hypothetical protein HYH02_008048 [Chlamydomonas schloesseri]